MFLFCFFFFNDTATTEIYTLSLHDAFRSPLPARSRLAAAAPRPSRRPLLARPGRRRLDDPQRDDRAGRGSARRRDRKSTRLNSSHANISYAVFCLKKKKNKQKQSHVCSHI